MSKNGKRLEMLLILVSKAVVLQTLYQVEAKIVDFMKVIGFLMVENMTTSLILT